MPEQIDRPRTAQVSHGEQLGEQEPAGRGCASGKWSVAGLTDDLSLFLLMVSTGPRTAVTSGMFPRLRPEIATKSLQILSRPTRSRSSEFGSFDMPQ
jgi:hypothetical protein